MLPEGVLLALPPGAVEAAGTRAGRFCGIYCGEAVEHALRSIYGRDGLCLKVLRECETWEGQSLEDVTRVQNIGAIYGVAPRVYDVVRLADGRPAQVTDWARIGGEPSLEALNRFVQVLLRQGIKTTKRIHPGGLPKWDIVISVCNWSYDLFLDWGGYYIEDKPAYIADLRQRIMVEVAHARRGQAVDATYQAMPQLNITGSRDTAHRIDAVRLDQIDFTGKAVLDLGCNLGAFTFYASRRGAKRVVGVDRSFIAGAMREAANWLGYWNVDIVGAALPEGIRCIQAQTGIDKFDIVLALAICNHVGGYSSWIADLCADVLVLEGHGGDQPEKYTDALARDFASVELVGYTTDHMRRPVFWCRRELI